MLKRQKHLGRWGGYSHYDDKLKAYLCVCVCVLIILQLQVFCELC